MSPWAAHFASGNVLFSGVALLLIAVVGAWKPLCQPSRKVRRLCLLLAVPLIAASATPIPTWQYLVWFVFVAGLFLLDRESESPSVRKWRRAAVGGTAAASLWVVVGEALTLLPPEPARHGDRFSAVYVIGDSVSAGMGDPADRVWPALMGRRNGVQVVNLAREGATVRSALRQAEQINEANCLVILEIGGNDMLGGVSSRQFDDDLTKLLREVSTPGRQVVLMELPLPPLFNEFGRIQRRRARQFGATLISKRVFAGVLAAPDATVDGVHLSPEGHELMAQRVWGQVRRMVED